MAQPRNILQGGGRDWVRRLNIMLRFSALNPWHLNNGAWENLLDDLYWAFFAAKRDRQNKESEFNQGATRPAVGEAQQGLQRLRTSDDPPELSLEKQKLTIYQNEETGFGYYLWSKHFPTNVYMNFAYLLDLSAVIPRDFLKCANCQTPFIPLRKPQKDIPSYCQPKCASVVAMRNLRKRQSAAKKKQRGKPTKIKRTPRKPK